MSKRVLFISYNFPPHGGPGVQRSLKFVKYLPEFGWQPIVIAADPEYALIHDPSLLDDVPNDTLVERFSGFSIRRLYRKSRKYKLDRAVVLANVLLQVPDTARFWVNSVRHRVLEVAERERPDLIYTTSGPFSAHLLGRWLRRRTGLPWFADFRDPWSKNLLTPYLPGYRALNARIERNVLAAADRVAAVSQPCLDDFIQNLGRDEGKFLLLRNGYDEDDIQRPAGPPSNDRLTMLHYGSFYRNRRPDRFLEAVRGLVDSGRIPVDEIRIVFVGRNAREAIRDEAPYEVVDYVPHLELNRFRAEADVLLLILDTSPANAGNYSGKIYEYIASNRPILGVVPPGGVAEQLIRETRTGITVGGEPSAIADAIEALYLQWKDGTATWNPDWEVIQSYTRKRITQRLAKEFDRMIEADPSTS